MNELINTKDDLAQKEGTVLWDTLNIQEADEWFKVSQAIIDSPLSDSYIQELQLFLQGWKNLDPLHLASTLLGTRYLGLWWLCHLVSILKGDQQARLLAAMSALNLSGNGAELPIPDNIGNLIWLHRLEINTAELVTLPKSIAKLKKLSTLCLRGNAFVTIPECVFSLENLELLDLENCGNLMTLDFRLLKLPKLKVVDVRGSKIYSDHKVQPFLESKICVKAHKPPTIYANGGMFFGGGMGAVSLRTHGISETDEKWGHAIY